MPSISPGNASTTAVTRRWPSGRSRAHRFAQHTWFDGKARGYAFRQGTRRLFAGRPQTTPHRRRSPTSTARASPAPPGGPRSKLPAGRNAPPLPSGGWSPGSKLLFVAQRPANTATCRAAPPDRARSRAHPAAARPANGSTPWPARPAAAVPPDRVSTNSLARSLSPTRRSTS